MSSKHYFFTVSHKDRFWAWWVVVQSENCLSYRLEAIGLIPITHVKNTGHGGVFLEASSEQVETIPRAD